MRNLSKSEVESLSQYLMMSVEEAQFVADTFVLQNKLGNIITNLDKVADYVVEWENKWHRENSFKDIYNEDSSYLSEDEIEEFAKTEEDYKKYALGKFVFQLEGKDFYIVC